MYAQRLGLELILIAALISSPLAVGKEILDFDLSLMLEQSRLARTSDSSPNFSLNSNTGYRAKAYFDKYFTNWWILHLGGEYAAYEYEASAARIIDELEPTEVVAEAGFKFRAGDFQLLTHYTSKPLPLLIDVADTINQHELHQLNVGMAVVGFRFEAISRYWDLGLEARGGFSTGELEFRDLTFQHLYSVEGTAIIQFGRTNKTLFEVVSLSNIIGKESLYGLEVTVREDRYKYGEDDYTLTNVHAGFFFKFIF